ncbi:TPA: hypothetical protein QDC24_008457, partial [Burkholderia cepacia ATCC 25416]|nr:hypothetical protein [Burkholderia cepacia ATCC 25416]
TNAINNTYKEILNSKHDVELRNGNAGWARAYLVKKGKRTGQYTSFRDNKQTVRSEQLLNTRNGSHLDIALKELLVIAKINNGEMVKQEAN